MINEAFNKAALQVAASLINDCKYILLVSNCWNYVNKQKMLVCHVIIDLYSFVWMIKWTHICMKRNEKKI